MMDLDDPSAWATSFGLAEAPLFGRGDEGRPGQHRVMLDGGSGTFALSVSEVPGPEEAASWAWSSGVTHHVGVGREHVVVVRWDFPGPPRRFTRTSVEAQVDTFYEFLLNGRVERGGSVVSHMIALFRSVRAATRQANAPDDRSLGVFLLALDDLAGGQGIRQTAVRPTSVDDLAQSVYMHVRDGRLAIELDRFRRAYLGTRQLDLHAALSIRHAGGLIFQEAHFEILRPAELDLLGHAGRGRLGTARQGAHFTPPAVARSVAEQTLANVEGLAARGNLTLLDPACGSGAFLHEAMRALYRAGFRGTLTVIGRDISAAAVDMARFVLARAALDWQERDQTITLDIQVSDSLVNDLPRADVVVMNPPFAAAAVLSSEQKAAMRHVLGEAYQGRPDLSMAFVTHALAALQPGGALGCLFPASLLTLESAERWRRDLVKRGHPRFLASIGDFGLFEFALVQVAAAVFTTSPASDGRLVTLWTSNDAEATGAALRRLRRSHTGAMAVEDTKAWRIGHASRQQLKIRDNWRLRAPHIEVLVEELSETLPTRVSDLFRVNQGIRTGNDDVFLLSVADWVTLPEEERGFFRRAITNASIRAGRIEATHYVFYPYYNGRVVFADEKEAAAKLPTYFDHYIWPNVSSLKARRLTPSQPWWALTRYRTFETGGKPRVVSKYFGTTGGFAADVGGDLAVVQGQSWYPKGGLARMAAAADKLDNLEVSPGFIYSYTALFNSKLFAVLLEAFSYPMAGGQYDLSARYVDAIHLPDLGAMYDDERRRSIVIALERLGADVHAGEPIWAQEAQAMTAHAYGLSAERLARL